MANVINWFEIPVSNFDRAKDFYTKVLGNELHIEEVLEIKMGFFKMSGSGVGGAICYGEGYIPSAEGALVYFNCGDDLQNELSKVNSSGGKVVLPKTKISDEIGYMAMFLDTEGNKVAFHSKG